MYDDRKIFQAKMFDEIFQTVYMCIYIYIYKEI